jgi:glycosyltransferase involved in cell wall biosynthesis
MRLVLVGPVYPYRGGIAHYTTRLARALAERHHVQVISYRRQYPAWLYPGRTDKDPSQNPLRVEAEYLLDPLNPATWRATAQRISGLAPDLLVLQWWNTFWAPATAWLAGACRKAGIRVLFLVHNVLPHEPRPWDRMLAAWALRHGDRFIVHTEAERERLLSLAPGACLQVCPMPMFDLFDVPQISQAEARQRLGLPPDKRILLFFGIIRPYKGLKYLLEALALLRDQGQDVYLVVAGEFWEDKAAYLEQIERAGLSAIVRLEDRYIPNEEVGVFFAAADVLVAPYVGGTQSAAVKAALAAGLPVVATERIAENIGDLAQQLVSVAAPGDGRSLARAVKLAFARLGNRAQITRPEWYVWRSLTEAVESAARPR